MYKTYQAPLKQVNTQYTRYCCWDFVLLKKNKQTKNQQAIKAMEKLLCFLKECGESNERPASLRIKTLSSWWFWIKDSFCYRAQGREIKPSCALKNTLIKWKLFCLSFTPGKPYLSQLSISKDWSQAVILFSPPAFFSSSFILLQRNSRNLTWFRVKIMYIRTPFIRLGGNTGQQ